MKVISEIVFGAGIYLQRDQPGHHRCCESWPISASSISVLRATSRTSAGTREPYPRRPPNCDPQGGKLPLMLVIGPLARRHRQPTCT